MACLVVGAEKAANHEPYEGLKAIMNLATNATNDPVLKKPEFGCVLSGTKGEYRPHLD